MKKQPYDVSVTIIAQRGSSQPNPLSSAQQRLWLHEQVLTGQPAYHMSLTLRLEGTLHLNALQQSLNEIVQRHEVLRTTFVQVKEQHLQLIAPDAKLPLHITDLKDVPYSEREETALRLITTESQRPFLLEQDFSIRAHLVTLNDQLHMLSLTTHQIASDDWTQGILLNELASIYSALVKGEDWSLPTLPIQYADFAIWQHQRWKQGTLDTNLTYWKEQLAALTVLELPTDHPRPITFGYKGSVVSTHWPAQLRERIASFSHNENASLYMTMLAAFQIILYRYTGQTDIAIGSAFANRLRAEVEHLVGPFANTLVMRTHLDGDPTFHELLTRVRKMTLEAYAHQDMPFDKLIEALQPIHDPSRSPLFQVALSMKDTLPSTMHMPELVATPIAVDLEVARFDMHMTVATLPSSELFIEIEYSTDLFERATIQRLLGHLETLLQAVVENANQHISELPLLTEAERQLMLFDWNSTDALYPHTATVPELFAAQVQRTPEAPALFFEGLSLSYHELWQRASQLAQYLRLQGIGPEILVGLCIERSFEMIVGIFGILLAGAAYVPLDPNYPRERLDFMLRDTHAPVLLTQSHLLERLPPVQATIICLDTQWQQITQSFSDTVSVSHLAPGNLAYVIYTSGSTGTPKGTLLNHRGLCDFATSIIRIFEVTPHDRILHFANVCFDVSVFEIFAALLSGAQLFLAKYETVISPPELTRFMQEHHITITDMPPTMLNLLSEDQLANLRIALVGGESFTGELVNRWLAPGRRFFNGYGPTESTVAATLMECSQRCEKSPPIGRPMPNHRMYVLDDYGQPVPIGVSGQLYIAGPGLARGYFHRADLTAEKFVPDAFSKREGDRMYASGDLVRYLPDGNIEFLGRIDHQVKIRGFRIELSEIEAVLGRHPAIQQAVVLAHADENGQKYLVGYLVAEPDTTVPKSYELRQWVEQRLPEYMIPSIFMSVAQIPLNSNGKVDGQKLPKPDHDRPELETNFVAPRTSTEQELALIWLEVLGIERVGVYDNFFELGGHSLLAIQLVSHVHEAFQTELPLRKLFETPTIADLAEQIEADRGTTKSIKVPSITRATRTGMLPLSYSQQRLWFLNQWEPHNPFYNEHMTLQLTGHLQIVALERSINEIVRRHEVLRTLFVVHETHPEQIINPALHIPLPLVDLEHPKETNDADKTATTREVRAQRLAAAEARRTFDLSQGPLLRAVLLRLEETEHILFLAMHHIVFDGWSTGLLFRELTTLYAAFAAGKPSPLPELPIQYVDYAIWQRQWLQGAVLEAQLSYWRQHLNDAPTLLNLPTDHPRPSVQSHQGSRLSFLVPENVHAALHQLSQAEGVTLFMTLLAAFQILLSRYSKQEDFLVGTPIANRTREETKELIGCFINMLVLRSNLLGNPSFRVLLQRVRKECLEAYAHQDLPFEQLVEALQLERTLSYNPLFQVMFVLQNASDISRDLPGLHVQLLEEQAQGSKFDLTLSMIESTQGFEGILEYNSDLFDHSTIERLQGHFLTLLQGIVTTPDQRVADLPLLTPREEEYLLHELNLPFSTNPSMPCLHQLVEAQVERSPNAIALVSGKESLTYHELNRRANVLASRLRTLGVGPEVLVGICVQRSLELVIGLLAILKAGGAYVPLDPTYPEERLSFILTDTQAPVLITQRAVYERLPVYEGTVLWLDEITGDERESNQPVLSMNPANLAYMIYTSGSTGRPKGVAITHSSAALLIAWAQKTYTPQELRAVLASTSICFDLSIFELFVPLSVGGSCILVDQALQLGTEAVQSKVTLVNTVPSVARELLRLGGFPATVQTINLAGEALPLNLVQDLYRQTKASRIFNLYGPSEDTTYSTYALLPADGTAPPPIGRPIEQTQVHLLDQRLRLVPAGLPGEIYLGGNGLARGYLNRADLTAERFVPDAFSGQVGARLYKTGDLARYRPDGSLEFLGRLDNQVKMRGFRIELGEIEAVLAQHPSVQTALVIVHESAPGNQRLVAYVVPQVWETAHSQEMQTITARELQHVLKEHLPEYMIPTIIVFLPELPLTPNGKVDRFALPAPEQSLSGLTGTGTIEGPRTPIEEILVQIWTQVLDHSQFSIHDDFFALGGHSLLATQILARLRRTFKMHVDLQVIFAARTVAQLAEKLVSCEPRPGHVATIARVHQQIGKLSAEEVRARLAGNKGAKA